jgi:hypothetical protein
MAGRLEWTVGGYCYSALTELNAFIDLPVANGQAKASLSGLFGFPPRIEGTFRVRSESHLIGGLRRWLGRHVESSEASQPAPGQPARLGPFA